MKPKGKLFAVGGAERKRANIPETSLRAKLKVLGRLLEEMKGTASRLEVIPTASAIPNIIAPEYLEVFRDMGCESVGILNIRTMRQADKKEYLERLRAADGVLFTGGDQAKIASALLGTQFLEILKHRYHTEPDFVICGTSAGAMMMSEVMIYGGQSGEALMTGQARLSRGLGLMTNSIVDSHFTERSRFGRLAAAVAQNDSLVGIGLGEDTGVIVREARFLEVVGSGIVCLYEPYNLSHNSASAVAQPLSFTGMRFSLLAQGQNYDLQKHKLVDL